MARRTDGHTAVGATLPDEPIMTVDPEVREQAQAFADGNCSLVGLHDWLASRAELIQDELEGELWGLVVAIDNGELTLEDARLLVLEQLGEAVKVLTADGFTHSWVQRLSELAGSSMRASYRIQQQPALVLG
jgi:hypothetical protein